MNDAPLALVERPKTGGEPLPILGRLVPALLVGEQVDQLTFGGVAALPGLVSERDE